MALLEKQLVVKTSTLPNAGKGLFTKKTIPKGTRIIEYKGTVTTWKEVDHNEGANGYIYYINRNTVINARPHPDYLARYANDARGIAKLKGVTNNTVYATEGLKVYIESTREIPAGAEIFVAYGKEYWNTIRHNIKLEKRQKVVKGY